MPCLQAVKQKGVVAFQYIITKGQQTSSSVLYPLVNKGGTINGDVVLFGRLPLLCTLCDDFGFSFINDLLRSKLDTLSSVAGDENVLDRSKIMLLGLRSYGNTGEIEIGESCPAKDRSVARGDIGNGELIFAIFGREPKYPEDERRTAMSPDEYESDKAWLRKLLGDSLSSLSLNRPTASCSWC